jgi:hypothetical protein
MYFEEYLTLVKKETRITQRRGYGWTAGFKFLPGTRDFVYFTASNLDHMYTQPPIRWILETTLPRVKLPKSEAGNSFAHSAEVKNGEAIIPLSHASHGMVLKYLSTAATLILCCVTDPHIAASQWSISIFQGPLSCLFPLLYELRSFVAYFPKVG